MNNTRIKLEAKRAHLQTIREKEDAIIRREILDNCNIEIDSVYDFINTDEPYPEAIETLLQIFEKRMVNDDVMLEGVIRALTRKYAKDKVERRLLDQYFDLSQEHKTKTVVGWLIGNALHYLYSDEFYEDIEKIVKEKENGTSRQMFVLALGKTKKNKEKAEDLLIKLTYDNDVSLHAIDALKKLKSFKAKGRMIELKESSKKTISKRAISYIKSSEKW